MNFRLALILGLLFVACLSFSNAEEEGKAEPEPGSEPEPGAEPEAAAEEDAQGSGSSVGKSGESKAGPNNPAPIPVPVASVIFAMAVVAKYIL